MTEWKRPGQWALRLLSDAEAACEAAARQAPTRSSRERLNKLLMFGVKATVRDRRPPLNYRY
jgi:hypothetical protein